MGGVAKPLVVLAGKPLVAHVVARLRPQVDAIVLSCGQDAVAYRHFGLPVVADRFGRQGPLGGIASAMAAVSTPWLLTTPADTPFLPTDLMASLTPACRRRGAAVVTAGGRRQNLVMLLDRANADSLVGFFNKGGRAAHRWLVNNAIEEASLPEAAFFNVNTLEDLERAEAGVG